MREWIAEFGRITGRDMVNARDTLAPGVPFAAVVVTGDVAETARPREYEDAAAFLGALAQEIELAPRRFVFCPGNHDVSWDNCQISD